MTKKYFILKTLIEGQILFVDYLPCFFLLFSKTRQQQPRPLLPWQDQVPKIDSVSFVKYSIVYIISQINYKYNKIYTWYCVGTYLCSNNLAYNLASLCCHDGAIGCDDRINQVMPLKK